MVIYDTLNLEKQCNSLQDSTKLTSKQICNNFRHVDQNWDEETLKYHELLVNAFSDKSNWDLRKHICLGNALQCTFTEFIETCNNGNIFDRLYYEVEKYVPKSDEEQEIRKNIIDEIEKTDP